MRRAPHHEQIAQQRLRAMAGCAGLVVVGLSILLRVIYAEASIGALLLLLGGAGIGWEARRIRLDARSRRDQAAVREARAVLSEARRERGQRERQERRMRRQTTENARIRQTMALKAARAQSLAAQQQEAEARELQRQQMEQSANRWLTLNADELATEAAALLVRRGLSLLPRDGADSGMMILAGASGARSLARCLPPDRPAHAVDIQDLDSRRREFAAEHAYLIALAGFSPAAVRLARSLPLTLVEAHLLAAWECGEGGSGSTACED